MSPDQMSSDQSPQTLLVTMSLAAGILCVLWLVSSPERTADTTMVKQEVAVNTEPEFRINAAAEANEPIVRWVHVEELPGPLAIFDSVFWEPDDTASLRKLIREGKLAKNQIVLEVGTGSGLISLCCLQAGADRVIATDINLMALRNAVFNAEQLLFRDRLEVRQVPLRDQSAWSVIRPEETFDLIISNPPWENQQPTTIADFALYDPNFDLLQSLVQGARKRLNRGGRMLLAYGCVTAIRKLQEVAAREDLRLKILDDRRLEDLPEVFLPGMLIELTVP